MDTKRLQIIVSHFLIFLILISCSENISPIIPDEESEFSENLIIKTNELQYNLNVDSWNNYYCSISGTLLNSTPDTFYSNLGDVFDSSFDQNTLTIAYQTDGYFEHKQENVAWENVEQFRLSEGSKIIRILPGAKYKIGASAIIDTNKLGDHRIRISYYKNYLSANLDTLRDTSNTFNIVK